MSTRLGRAIERNIGEVLTARHQRIAIQGMNRAESLHGWDFFRLAQMALFNDIIARSIKVFDRNTQSASFWYIWRCMEHQLKGTLASAGITIHSLNVLTEKLKVVRDKTHFHIDCSAVLKPANVWKDAGIKGRDLYRALDGVSDVLKQAHRVHFKKEFNGPGYDGNDIERILRLAIEAGLLKR